jgi:hypothetical protein
VPLDIVLDLKALERHLCHPANLKRGFHWPALSGPSPVPAPVGPGGGGEGPLLHIVDAKAARGFLAEHVEAFCLVIQPEDDLSVWLSEYGDRVCAVCSQLDVVQIFAQVQGLFSQIALWTSAMELALARRASLQQLLDEGEQVLPDFIYLYDGEQNLLACTKSMVPPSSSYVELEKTGNLRPGQILSRARKDFEAVAHGDLLVWVERAGGEQAGTEGRGCRLFSSIEVAGAGVCTIVMVGGRGQPTKGQVTLFALFVSYAQRLCRAQWRRSAALGALPRHELLDRLLDGRQLHNSYIETQARRLSVPTDAELKLLQIGPLPPQCQASLSSVLKEAGKLNGGECIAFGHEDRLLVLCHCEKGDERLSVRRMDADVRRHIQRPFGATASSSQVFPYLKNLELAYRQTNIAYDFKEAVDAERLGSGPSGPSGPKAVYAFEDAFLFYRISQPEPDARFLAFSLSHTILEKIRAEDVEHGTDDMRLLWLYLQSERRASVVAEALHMHRNTVIYRIERIRRRFDIDFTEQGARERLLLDYKVYFLAATGRHQLARKIRKNAPLSS